MIALPPARCCRLSGEPLEGAPVLFDLAECPVPGIYPESAEESVSLTTPLRVIQAAESGLVQLAHVFDESNYRQYAFAGGASKGYRRHLREVAAEIAESFPRESRILEIGCGDGALLEELAALGMRNVHGIDPSRSIRQSTPQVRLATGYFPGDLPSDWLGAPFDLIILRHVLEHVETPLEFVRGFPRFLSSAGQVWVEVPDLESTVRRQIWNNFYQLHCNYFEIPTLDRLMADAGFRCTAGRVVDVFGGSLLRQYARSETVPPKPATRWENLAPRVNDFHARLNQLVQTMPRPITGYGAAERTAVTFGILPALSSVITRLCDGNPLLHGRYLAGTSLRIEPPEALRNQSSGSVLLFAISHVEEITARLKPLLPTGTRVGLVGNGFTCLPLADYA